MNVDKLNYYFNKDKEPSNTISDHLNFELVEINEEKEEFTLQLHVTKWMCNLNGTIHGGMSATIVDQAMGLGTYSAKPGKQFCATIEMNMNYHRPLFPDDDVLVRVKLRSVGRQHVHTACEVYRVCEPDKLCVSATGVYFTKNMEE